MAKIVTFDYEKVTPTMMTEFVRDNLDAKQKSSYKSSVINSKGKVDKAKARKWLMENLKNDDRIEWINVKIKNKRKASLIDMMKEW